MVDCFVRFFDFKISTFSSEKEWRVIWTVKDNASEDKTYFPEGLTRPVHYVDLPLDDWEVVEIICGPRAAFLDAEIKFKYQPTPVPIVKSAIKLQR